MKRFAKFLLISLFPLMIASCGETYDPIYGTKVNDNLSSDYEINDNYRNYYEIFVGSYSDSNNDGMGDLNGVTNKLDYIKDLGYNGIWLVPINKSPSYHKYDVMDYYSIDNNYGSLDDLTKLIDECHKRNIKLIIALVLNHSSIFNELFTKSVLAHEAYINGYDLTDEENKFKDFYSFYDDKNLAKCKIYQVPNKNFYYEANFSSSMPEFNFDSPYVHEEIRKIAKFYLDKGIDGFRLDAVKYYYINSQAKNIDYLTEFGDYVKSINKDAYIVGECWDSSSVISGYYGSSVDSYFNFNAATSNGFIANSLNRDGGWLKTYYSGMEENLSLANGHLPAPFLTNHDMPRMTLSDLNITKFRYELLSLINGVTFSYYGDEIGMTGTNTSGNPDQNVRTAMKWSDKEMTDQPVGFTKAEYPNGSVYEQEKDETSILNYYKKANLIRNNFKEISHGEPKLISVDTETKKIIFTKDYLGSRIGFVINFASATNFEINLKDLGFNEVKAVLNVDSKKAYVGMLKDGNIIIPPYGI